jgi:BRCT domain type II-containing protein
MSDLPSKPLPSPIAIEDLDYLAILAGFGCVVPDGLVDSKAPVNALPALNHQRSHLKLAHRPSILKDKFLDADSQESTPRESINLPRDEIDELKSVAEGAGHDAITTPQKRARRTSSLGRIRSSNPSPSVRRTLSTPKLKGLNEHPSPVEETVPPWTIGDDSLSEKESMGKLAALGATKRKGSTSSERSLSPEGRSKSLSGRVVVFFSHKER